MKLHFCVHDLSCYFLSVDSYYSRDTWNIPWQNAKEMCAPHPSYINFKRNVKTCTCNAINTKSWCGKNHLYLISNVQHWQFCLVCVAHSLRSLHHTSFAILILLHYFACTSSCSPQCWWVTIHMYVCFYIPCKSQRFFEMILLLWHTVIPVMICSSENDQDQQEPDRQQRVLIVEKCHVLGRQEERWTCSGASLRWILTDVCHSNNWNNFCCSSQHIDAPGLQRKFRTNIPVGLFMATTNSGAAWRNS